MRRTVLSALLSCALLLGLAGCAAQTPSPAPDCAPAEGDRLVVYTSHKEEVWRPIVKEFEERTGIWVDVVYGPTSELLKRVAQEEKSPQADVMFGGGAESLTAYRHCFTPYACAGADRILARFRAPDGLWTPFSALPVVLIYNTKLVAPGEVTRWADLLDPRLKGRIASPTRRPPGPPTRRWPPCCPPWEESGTKPSAASRKIWGASSWSPPVKCSPRWPTGTPGWESPWRRAP